MSPRAADRKRRILLDFLSYSPTDGGFTTVLENLLVCAASLDEFEFGILYNRHYRQVFQHLPFEKIEVRTFRRKLRYLTSLVVVPWVLRKHRFDGLHAETSILSPLVKIPTSMMVHDLYALINPGVGRSGIIRKALDRLRNYFYVRGITSSTVVGAISECTRRDVRRLTGRTGEIVLITHAIEFPHPQPSKRAWPEGSETLRLLCVGSLVPRKNVALLIEALPKFKVPWELDIVGNLWQEVNGLNRDSHHPRVRLHGFVSDAELHRLYETSHLIILPSLYEGFGLPAAEAVAHRCLALTSSGSAFDEYIPDECRFDPHNSDQLASIVNNLHAEQYYRLLAESELSVRRFTRARQIEGYKAAFSLLFRGRQPGEEAS